MRGMGLWAAAVVTALMLWPCQSMAMVDDRFADLPDVSLRFRDEGPHDAPVILLLHEMGMTLESWDAIVPDLAKDHRVIRYDLRGFGLSEKIGGAVTMRQEVADLSALLDMLEVKKPVTLIGGAVGGAIALAFAADHADRIAGVMAISPATGIAPEQRDSVLASAARIERTGIRALLSDMTDVYPDAIRNNPQRLARFRALQLSSDPTSMAATLRMIATTDYGNLLPHIHCPVMIVGAEFYPARPVASMKALAATIAGAQFRSLATGHFMALQSPELLLPLIRDFLHSQGQEINK